MRVRPTRLRRLRIRKAIGNAAIAATVVAGGVAYLALQKNVTLVVNGHPQAVQTLTGNVGALLTSEGIRLESGDVVEPPVHTSLIDGMTVVVDTDRTDPTAATLQDSMDVGVWVMDGVTGPGFKLAPSTENVSADGTVGPTSVVSARVVVKGKEHDVLTNATTIGELLSAMGIEPDALDRVHPSPSTPLHPGGLVRFVDVDVRMRDVELAIPYRTMTTYTDSLDPGVVRISQHGSDGTLVETWRVRVVDGTVVSRTKVGTHVATEAVPAIRLVGRRQDHVSGTEVGEAAWYETPGTGLTAAHPWLPFGTIVTVTDLANGKSVTVVINDRGPFGGRIIDLSEEAFAKLAPLGAGVEQVRLTW